MEVSSALHEAAGAAPDTAAIVTLPPFIDCHVHFREPGLEHKATIASESAAAYYGGIAAVCDMPNTNPPTQTIAALADKVHRATATAHPSCSVYFFFGATKMEHLQQLEELWTDPTHAALKARCTGLKLYLDNSTGDLKSSTTVTEAAFALCGRLQIVLVAHCEQSEINNAAASEHPYDGPAAHSLRRPADSEVASVAEAIAMAQRYRTPLHLAHISASGSLDAVRQARRDDASLRLTCEVTPHHLFLSTGDYCSCGAKVKVNPPVRPPLHSHALWEAVLDGTVDCIGTDHAPHTIEEKNDVAAPPSGMPAVEVVVPLLLSVIAGRWPHPTAPPPPALAGPHSFSLDTLTRLMHTNPSRIFQIDLSHSPSRRFDTAVTWVVRGSELHSKCGWSPYEGWLLQGRAM